MARVLDLISRNRDPIGLLEHLSGGTVYPHSITPLAGNVLFLCRQGASTRLGCLGQPDTALQFQLTRAEADIDRTLLTLGLGETNAHNAAALRALVPHTASSCLGLAKSVGLGDRLGIATPGHIRALRAAPGMRPILAQQSIREMGRTARTPQDVIDAATWGVLQEGWTDGYGSDADHLKTRADIDVCAAAGFCLYTLDPRDHVDNAADTDDAATLSAKLDALPWSRLETSLPALRANDADQSWDIGDRALTCNDEELARAAVKYGSAIAHLAEMYRHLLSVMGDRPFEVEISVDETETPTRPVEHLFIAKELQRLGVRWVSLAPRFVGRFEKGVDYIGDLTAFEQDFAWHASIARALGPYKLSLHSGSDKFSIYPIAARLAGDLVHLKTAGTSYLEALRTLARVDSPLFREILAFAIEHYEQDKASYHVSARIDRMLTPGALSDEQLPAALDQFDTRQALHVTFGTVMTQRTSFGALRFRDRIYQAATLYEEEHYAALRSHFVRHMQPFINT